MTELPPPIPLTRLVPIAAAAVVGLVLGMALRGSPTAADPPAVESAIDAWTCSMHPQIQETQSGSCPLCGMDLVPAQTSGDGPTDAVVLTDRARTMARLRTTPVAYLAEEGSLLRLLGRLEPAETERRSVTAWVGGRIDRLVVTTTGEPVRRGQVIANLYSPEIYAAHQDLLTARQQLERLSTGSETAKAAARAALDAARDRIRLLGVPSDELKRLEDADTPTETVAIRTPHTGTVLSRDVTQGEYVQTGSTLFEVARLDPLWVQLDAYEQDLNRLSVGQTVRLDVDALPGESFEGRVSFVDPTLDPVRRTARVRVEVANPDGRLRPGFFAEAVVETAIPQADAPLVIPTSAALYTGRRSVVYVEEDTAAGLAYRPRTVRLGPRIGDVYPVLSGLENGERVVSRGAFVLDADLQLRGGASMMTRPDDPERSSNGPIALRKAERSALAPVLEAYLTLQTALAADDFSAAR
ncbi:MAG: efflux transporter periplasmic adaptor subunit, partial [Deltaproteobacteria bacterium]|nr:efflux transporter periplasmic adaptor subunit [Deltaproteobacteria bacterium]